MTLVSADFVLFSENSNYKLNEVELVSHAEVVSGGLFEKR